MPYAVANSFVGLGLEADKGTAAASPLWVPVMSPQVTAMQKWLRDEGVRGSPVSTYDDVLGVRNDTYEGKVNAFSNLLPILIMGALGAADTKTASPSATTVATGHAATAGSTTLYTTAAVAVGAAIKIDTGNPVAESNWVADTTGSGPYELTLASPLVFAHAAGAAVAGLTSHQLGLQNDQVGSQPFGITIQDFDGANAYQMTAGQIDTLDLTFGAEAALEAAFKMLANPFSSIDTPSNTPPAGTFIPAWNLNATVNGNQVFKIADGAINIKRGTEAVFTGNQSNSGLWQLFAGPCDTTGKLTFVVESGDPILTNGLGYQKFPITFQWTDPHSDQFVYAQMSRCQIIDPKRTQGKIYTEVECNYTAEANTTDAVTGGYSPIQFVVGNTTTGAYVGS